MPQPRGHLKQTQWHPGCFRPGARLLYASRSVLERDVCVRARSKLTVSVNHEGASAQAVAWLCHLAAEAHPVKEGQQM